jgi:hypothetical protein
LILLHSSRDWTCPRCGACHKTDHDIPDLTNLECGNCDCVVLGRVLPSAAT